MLTFPSNTLLNLFLKGGWLMIPLGILSLTSLYVIVERILVYRKHLNISRKFLENLQDSIKTGDFEQIQACCNQYSNVIQQILMSGISQKDGGRTKMALVFKNESKKAIMLLEDKLSLLVSIAEIAPMIGFLGTVTGMIKTFMAISKEQVHGMSQSFANGVYEAMMTTVLGLVISIVAYAFYNYFTNRVNRAMDRLESVLDLVMIQGKPRSNKSFNH